ncbi:MAG: type II toxin-antitoxin system PemK/MazF family toxin [Tepidiformaceae bacterium]
MRRGEVWWARLPEPFGRRPVLLLTRDGAYAYLSLIVVAPLTTRIRDLRSHVPLDPVVDHVPAQSCVNADHLQAIGKEWLEERITTLGAAKLADVEAAIHFALALER